MRRACYLTGELLYWILCLTLILNIILCIFGIRPFIVVSGSMEPAIKTGSISWVNCRADARHMERGDILAFERNDGELVLHRIVHRTEAGMVTKGDANKAPDAALVRAHQIKGKVLFTVPYVGKAFMKSTKEFAAFFITGSLILFITLKTVKISGGTYHEKNNVKK